MFVFDISEQFFCLYLEELVGQTVQSISTKQELTACIGLHGWYTFVQVILTYIHLLQLREGANSKSKNVIYYSYFYRMLN